MTSGILVALHGKGLTATCLTVDENRSMETCQDLLYQIVSSRPLENIFLTGTFVKNLVEGKALFMVHLIQNAGV